MDMVIGGKSVAVGAPVEFTVYAIAANNLISVPQIIANVYDPGMMEFMAFNIFSGRKIRVAS